MPKKPESRPERPAGQTPIRPASPGGRIEHRDGVPSPSRNIKPPAKPPKK